MKNTLILAVVALSLALTGCKTLDDISSGDIAGGISDFELTPTKTDSYWYDGREYDYKEYEIKISSEPVTAKILWNGKQIGASPAVYRYTGVTDTDTRIIVKAVPFDNSVAPAQKIFNGDKPLPREIKFDLK